MKILVCDDEPSALLLIDRAFDGLTIPTASLDAGLEAAYRLQPKCILLDNYFLGDRATGIDAIAPFRNAAPGASILMMSAECELLDVLRAQAAGAWGFMEKFDEAELRRLVPQAIAAAAPTTLKPCPAPARWRRATSSGAGTARRKAREP